MIPQYVIQAVSTIIGAEKSITEYERQRIMESMREDSASKPAILKITEACTRLNVSRTTLYKLIKSGKITPFHSAGTKLNSGVTAASVEQYIREAS